MQEEGAVAALGHIFPQDAHPFPREAVRDRWVAELDDPTVRAFAVVQDGGLVGFAATCGAELLHFGTARPTWGSGLAGRVHDEVVDVIAADGHHRAWLRVFEENRRAVRFYARRGWSPTGEVSSSSFAPYPTLVRFERDLA